MKQITKKLVFALMLLNSFTYSQTGWVLQTSPAAQELHDVFFVNQNTGWAAGRFNAGGMIIKTTNGGLNWFTQFNADNELLSSHFTNESTGYVCGTGGLFLKTTNSGINWSSQVLVNESFGLLSVYFLNNNIGFISTSLGIVLHTTDAGLSWVQKNTGSNNPLRDVMFINFQAGSLGLCMGSFVPNNRIYNFGTINSWLPVFLLPSDMEPRDIWFMSNGNAFVVGDGNKIARRLSFGQFQVFTIAASNLYCVQFTDSLTGYVCGENGAVMKSNNNGLNWVFQQSNTTNRLRDLHFINALTGWAVGDNGTIIKTITGGETAPRAPLNLTALAVSSSQINLNWIDSSNNELKFKIERSTNAGSNWLLIDSVIANVTSYNHTGLTPNTIYLYRVYANNAFGNSSFSNIAFDTTFAVTGVIQQVREIPGEYELFNNYPNPFNPTTNIRFAIPQMSFVKITVYDLLGRQVEKLVDENLNAGVYKIDWNANKYSSGVYYYRLETERFTDIKKMILVK